MNSLTPLTPDPEFQLTGPMEDPGAPASSFRIQRLLPYLLKYWWVPILTLTFSLIAASAFVFWKAPAYVSKGRMWETLKMRLPQGAEFSEDSQTAMGTQTELLQSAALREAALARLRAATNNVIVPLGKDREPLPVTLRVVGSAKSTVFALEATSAQSAYSQAYLEALMASYMDFKKNLRAQVSGYTVNSLSTQIGRTEKELKADQDILLAYQRTNNMASLQQEGTINAGYLATLKTKVADLELESRLLEAATLDSAGTNSSGTNTAAGTTTEKQPASKEVELLKMQRKKLSTYLRPKHPKIAKLDAEIETADKLSEIFRRQSREQLAASRQENQVKMQNYLDSIKKWETKVETANIRLAEADRLKVNVQRNQSFYDRLTMLLENVVLGRNIDQDTLEILEHATPAKRSFTQEIGVLAVASAGGLGLGLGIILLVTLRDDRFTSLLEVNDKLGQVIVGQVPEVSGLPRNTELPLLEIHDERHAYAESYRSLRSAILFMATNGVRPKVILITSALPDEGKSTIAANLARTMALGGARVVLVDGDLRKGTLHTLMGMKRGPGLAELLCQSGDLDNSLQTNSTPNLAFISSGGVVRNSGDLFLGPEFDQLIVRLRQKFDYVIIDSSPVFAADDATTLAPKVDGTLFVVRSRFSRAGPAREALELLYQRQAKVLGVIFNQADSSARSYYYYKYADYQHPAVNSP